MRDGSFVLDDVKSRDIPSSMVCEARCRRKMGGRLGVGADVEGSSSVDDIGRQ